MNRHPISATALAMLFCTLAATARAQDTQPPANQNAEIANIRRLVWKDALCVFECATGPSFLTSWGNTAFGQAMSSPPMQRALAEFIELEFEEDDERLTMLADLWTEFTKIDGRIVGGLRMDANSKFAGGVAIRAATNADAERLDAMCARLETQYAEASKSVMVDDIAFRVVQDGEMTLPRRVRDVHVLWFGKSIERMIESSLANKEVTALWLELEGSMAWANIDLHGFIESLNRRFDARGKEPSERKSDSEFLRAIGVEALQSLQVTVRSRDNRIHMDLDWRIERASPQGLLGPIFWPAHAKLDDAAARILPTDAGEITCMQVDPSKVYDAAIDTFASLFRSTTHEVERRIEQRLRLDVRDDLVRCIGNTYFSTPAFRTDREDDAATKAAAVDGACYAMTLTDREKFEKSLERVIRSFALHVSRKKELIDDVKLYSLNFLGLMDVHYAVADTFFVVGLGNKARPRIATMLHNARNPNPETTWASRLGSLAEHAPPGFHSVTILDLAQVAAEFSSFMTATGDDVDPWEAEWMAALQKIVDTFARESARLGARRSATFGANSDERFLYRIVQ